MLADAPPLPAEPYTLPDSMPALFLTDNGPEICERPLPIPAPGEALIRVRMAGVCSTDLELMAGYKGGYRGILGHEFVGEIVRAASAPHRAGERVVGEINIGCAMCDLCLRGLHKHCRARTVLGIIGRDGAFARYLTLPLANLHSVPRGVNDRSAVFTEPLAAALQILEQVTITPSTRVYILGPGRLGQLVAQVLRLHPCESTLIGRNRAKLAVAALRGILTAHSDSADQLAANPADVVVEVTGSPEGFALARRLVRPGGTIVLKSTYTQQMAHFDASNLVVDEITLVGSRCGPFAPALELLRRKDVDPRPLISRTFALSDGLSALQHAARPDVIKVLIDPAA